MFSFDLRAVKLAPRRLGTTVDAHARLRQCRDSKPSHAPSLETRDDRTNWHGFRYGSPCRPFHCPLSRGFLRLRTNLSRLSDSTVHHGSMSLERRLGVEVNNASGVRYAHSGSDSKLFGMSPSAVVFKYLLP